MAGTLLDCVFTHKGISIYGTIAERNPLIRECIEKMGIWFMYASKITLATILIPIAKIRDQNPGNNNIPLKKNLGKKFLYALGIFLAIVPPVSWQYIHHVFKF